MCNLYCTVSDEVYLSVEEPVEIPFFATGSVGKYDRNFAGPWTFFASYRSNLCWQVVAQGFGMQLNHFLGGGWGGSSLWVRWTILYDEHED